ncbi:MAG: hypothetical protein K2L90_09390, partial [Muribaculaceae bacterium]|nr:hypothetical protein [Muribaculaceae bacterium]
MDSNEKKPKRPRIGENRETIGDSQDTSRFEKVEYTGHTTSSDYHAGDSDSEHQYGQGGYQQRPYNNNNNKLRRGNHNNTQRG